MSDPTPVKYIVFDEDNRQAWGPYDSEAEAEADILKKAQKDDWVDVLEVATHDGWLTDGSTETGQFRTQGLHLVELDDSKEP